MDLTGFFPVLVAFGCSVAFLDAQAVSVKTRQADVARNVVALLRARCFGCHGAQQQMSGLRLDSREGALRGGYSGPAIRPGKSAESTLIQMVAGVDPKRVMPLSGPRLAPSEVDTLRAWVDEGANWPASKSTADDEGLPSTSAKPTHWSFQPVERPKPPLAHDAAFVRNAIDQFVLARLESKGIKPSAEASKTTLLRRVSLDLTGLPPTLAEADAFLSDSRPDAYERVVDRLLESPHYGEKWAREWLDLARYADSDGYEKDTVRPHAWRYRNWVIDALNRDMPYDEFVIEQIAGDLLPNATVEQKVATGFQRNAVTNREDGIDVEQFRNEKIVDRTATFGTVFLGLTVGCAQCHDHKFDPIKQRDFYRLFAFFNNTEEVDIEAPLSGEIGPYLKALPGYRAKRKALLAQYHVPELQPAWEAKMKEARANPGKWTDWDKAYTVFQVQFHLDDADKVLDTDPGQRTEEQADLLTDHFVINYYRVISKDTIDQLKFSDLRRRLAELKASIPFLSEAQTLAEDAVRRKTWILIRGDYKSHGIEVQPGMPAFLNPVKTDAAPSRLTLAKWTVSPDNPLAARVVINRMWQAFFGRGIVSTSDDFGTQGDKPSNPELLDWLAKTFMDGGWSVKRMHRLIVTSATYRQSSKARQDLQQVDPANTLLARQNRLRLPAELIRDSALVASDLLYPSVGGKSVRPAQPKGVADLAYADHVSWKESEGQERYRRGLYIHLQRTVPYPMLVNFDGADAGVSVCKRDRSNTPLQALNLLNDPVFVEAAQALAARILREGPGSFTEMLTFAFRTCLARQPSPTEIDSLASYFDTQKKIFQKDVKAAALLAPFEVNGRDPIDAATWASAVSVLLNLDEFITRE
jgi:hypothetical protein